MLSILEYSEVGSTQRGSLSIPLEPPLAVQTIEVEPTNLVSDPMSATTAIVKIASTVDAVFDVGTDPDATGSQRRLRAGVEQVLTVPAGKGMRIAVMASGGTSMSGIESLEGLLGLVAAPAEFKSRVDKLIKETAKHTAAAKAHTDAIAASSWFNRLDAWEANLAQREKDVTGLKADLEARIAKFKAIAA